MGNTTLKKRVEKPRPANQVDAKFYTTPPTISLEEAAEKVKRKKPHIHYAIATFEINFADILGVHGKRIVLDKQWDDFVDKCRILDKLNK